MPIARFASVLELASRLELEWGQQAPPSPCPELPCEEPAEEPGHEPDRYRPDPQPLEPIFPEPPGPGEDPVELPQPW